MVTINNKNEPTAALGKVLQGQGVGTTSNFSTATYPATATGTGKILRADGTNWVATTATYPDLAGTNLNVLTSDGTNWSSATAPVGSGADLTYITSVTASASATVDFSNNLSATYDNYWIIGENIVPDTNPDELNLRVGTGAGPTYQTTSYTDSNGSTLYINFISGLLAQTNTSTTGGALRILISNVNNATNYKTVSAFMGINTSGIPAYNAFSVAGRWESATVITSIRLFYLIGNISTGTFRLYGFKN